MGETLPRAKTSGLTGQKTSLNLITLARCEGWVLYFLEINLGETQPQFSTNLEGCQMDSLANILNKTDLHRTNVNVNKYNLNNVINVRRLAYRILDKLGDPHSLRFYYKVAWHLTEQQIDRNLEIALAGRSPQKYFAWLCTRQLDVVNKVIYKSPA